MFEQYPDVLTVRQVMELLHLERDNTYALIRCGQIPSVKVKRQIRVTKQAVMQFLRMQSNVSKR